VRPQISGNDWDRLGIVVAILPIVIAAASGVTAVLVIAVIATVRGMVECRPLPRSGAAQEGMARDWTSASEG
jgi:hypothetical protein